jgi:hypothetical protein
MLVKSDHAPDQIGYFSLLCLLILALLGHFLCDLDPRAANSRLQSGSKRCFASFGGLHMPSTLRKLSAEAPSATDLTEAMEQVSSDHPRSAAILGATFLEDVVRLSIITKMVDLSKDEQDRLFVGTGPLSSFSAKTQLSYALGLIGKKARHDIDTIREIRNVFAHAKINISFQTEAVANAINGLHFRALLSDWDTLTIQRRFGSVVRLLMIYIIWLWATPRSTDMQTIRDFDPPPEATPISFEDG